MKRAIKQFMRFALVGCINTGLDFSVYAILTRFFSFWQEHYLCANFIAFTMAMVNSFLINKSWTFKNKSKKYSKQYAKFFLVSCMGLLLTEFILYFFVEAGLHDLLAKLLAIGVVLFWNFFANKLWTFNKD